MSVTTDKIHHNLTSQYEYIEGTEDLNNYRPGGYPVLQVGDHLDFDRYKIIHKLGYGGSSTTWLAHDHQTSELVTIKACTHESNARPHEAEYLSLFSDNKFVRRLLASFTLNGPNGSHRCLVMEPATCSLASSKTASFHQLIPLSTARGIIADLIKTVQEFHARGVVHGDLHVGNIMLRFPHSLRKKSHVEIYQTIGHPIQYPVIRLDKRPLSQHVPSTVYWPAWLTIPSHEIPDDRLPIMISDFGETFEPAHTTRRHMHTLPALTPPESLLAHDNADDNDTTKAAKEAISFPSEIWTLGCTIFELMGDRSPFDPWDSSRDEMLFEHVCVLGKLPEPWWSRWTSRSTYFDDQATHDVQDGARKLLDDNLEKRYEWCIAGPRRRQGMEVPGQDEKKAFLDLIGIMLRLDPNERGSIEHVAQTEWVRQWARR